MNVLKRHVLKHGASKASMLPANFVDANKKEPSGEESPEGSLV
jgi:hypothetical protein